MKKERSYPFYTENEIQKNSEGWKSASQKLNYEHNEHRKEERPESHLDVAYLHATSFIRDVIPKLIAKAKDAQGGKVKILDVGAGAAEYANQIREQFGDAVEVITTGLAKSKARRHLSRTGRKLSPEDLKLNSIFQMSDYPEFDLIIDTFGEQYYVTEQAQVMENDVLQMGLDSPEKFPMFERYVKAVAAKLKPGGFASVYPVITNHPEVDRYFDDLITELAKVDIELTLTSNILRLKKTEIINTK